MIVLDKIIKKYQKYVIDIYLEDDFLKKTKVEKKVDDLIDKVYEHHVENDFYNELFQSKEPFILAHIANISFCRNYDLYKSLEILGWIKNNAYDLTFTENQEKNRFWQENFSKRSVDELKRRILFYEKVADHQLFLDYYHCLHLFDCFYLKYLYKDVKESRKYMDSIFQLVAKVKKVQKESKFFEILLEESQLMPDRLYYIMTCYVMCKFGYRKDEARARLSQILENEIPLVMWKMLKEFISEVE